MSIQQVTDGNFKRMVIVQDLQMSHIAKYGGCTAQIA